MIAYESDVDLAPLPPFDGHPPSASRTRADAMARFGHDTAIYERIVPLFGTAATGQANAIIEAVGAADRGRIAHWAHTLKGSLLTVGAMQTAIRAERVELAAREGRIDGLMPWALQLAAETAVIAGQLALTPPLPVGERG
jgi:HPt (histidine-containing phosphotransfer) domain-containing protein